MALEPEFWGVLERIAARRAQPVSALVRDLDSARTAPRPLASALRVFALLYKDDEPAQSSF